MRILIATGLYPPEVGGPATYTKLLEERLPALGFDVAVLPFSVVRRLPKILRHAAYFWKCFRMARRADIVFAQDTVSVGLPAALAAKLARKKFVVRVPGDYSWEQGVQRFGVKELLDDFQHKRYGARVESLRAVQKFVTRQALAVIVPSGYMKGIVDTWADPKKVCVIYSSIDLSVPYELPRDRPEGFLIVSSGRRVPWKHFDAIERVVAREPTWHFSLAENLPRPQALGWIKAADVFVLNSTYEGLSHTLVEAMMLGTPIVATEVGGNPELIANGVDGLLIPPKDDEALYAALQNIQQHKEEARARAESARAKTKQFSIDTTIKQLVALLNDMNPTSLKLRGARVLMITGDRNFKPGNPRYDLQARAVEQLSVVFWGRGHLWPHIPKGPFDIVTAQDPFLRGHLAAHLAWFFEATLNLQVHTDLSALPWLKRAWAGFNLRKASSVRVVSEKIKKQVEQMGVKAPIYVLPIFIDIERFRSLQRQTHGQKTILWIGRFEEEKDPLYAISVLQKVREAGVDARLVLLGAGSLEKSLRTETARLNLAEYVEFSGWQKPEDYLALANVVLCTSKHESYGASIIEALAAGVPVVAPDVGIALEAGAIVVPRSRSANLAEKVVEVIRSGKKGELKLKLPTAEEWAKAWYESLLEANR